MEIHKPHAAKSFKEFVIELGTIVAGILIALSLEQVVEAIHWRHAVNEGRERLHAEIKADLALYVHRNDVAACVKDNLATLNTMILAMRSKKHLDPVAEFQSPSNGPTRHVVWNALNAAQVLIHFPKEELEQYSSFYTLLDDDTFLDRESRAWRQLHLLEGDPNQLTPQDISTLRVAAGEAEEMGSIAALIAKRQIDLATGLGVEIPAPNPDRRKECLPIKTN